MDKFVDKAFKMPHSIRVGYYLINDNEKILVSFYDDNVRYFNFSQKNAVIKNADNLTSNNLIEIPREVVNESSFFLGDTKMTGSVLNDNRRVIRDTSLFKILDRTRKGEVRVQGYPPIIGSQKLASLLQEINSENLKKIMPIEVHSLMG